MKDKLFKTHHSINAVHSFFWCVKAVIFVFLFSSLLIPLLYGTFNVPIKVAIVIALVFAIFISYLVVKRRISAVKKSLNVKENTNNSKNIKEADVNEKVLGAIFAITKTVGKSVSFLGSGENKYPENTLVFTNKRILFSRVPVYGGSSVMDHTPAGRVDAAQMNMLFNKSGIRKKGKEILSKGLTHFIDNTEIRREIQAENVDSVKMGFFALKIKTLDGKKYTYTPGDMKSRAETKDTISKLPY